MTNIVVLKSRLAVMGGLERYARAIAASFAKQGHTATLLTTGDPIEIEGVRVLSLGPHLSSTRLSLPFFEQAVKAWLIKFPQEIVFGLDRNTFQTHYRAGNGSHRTYLHHNNSALLSKLRASLNPKDRRILKSEKALFENPSLKTLFTNSHMVRAELLKLYKIHPNKIHVVHNGVDLEKFSFDENSKRVAMKQLKISSSKIHFLFIGNNYKRKGLHLILKALAKMRDKDFKLSVVGKDKNVSKYQRLAKKYLIQDKVLFWGHQENLLPFYQASDCFILPSFYDPFANVTIEALAMGLFVITSPYNGGHEVLTKQTGHTLSNLKNTDELRGVLENSLSSSWSYSDKLDIRKTIQHLEIKAQLDRIAELTLSNS